MAIAKMRRLKLIGLIKERNKILKTLVRSNMFEVAPTKGDENLSRGGNELHLNRVVAKQAKVAFGINFLNVSGLDMASVLSQNQKDVKRNKALELIEYDYSKPKPPMGRQIIGYDDFYDVAAKEFELLTVCDELEKISFNRLEIKSKLSKLDSINKNLMPFINLPIKFSQIADTKHTFMAVATGSVSKEIELLSGRNVICQVYPSSVGMLAVIIGKREEKDDIMADVAKLGLSVCSYRYDKTAADMIAENREESEQLSAKAFDLLKEGLAYEKYLTELQVLYDVLGQDIETASAELDFIKTRDTFILEGWIPADVEENIIARVKEKTENFIFSFSEPSAEDDPPTLIVSNKIFEPYQDVTNLYSVPKYNESDPNPVMALFFFVFFGIMIGDAGYGLILAVVCSIVLKFVKLEKGMSKMMALLLMGGISAIIWGVVFGGVFGIEGIPPLWFNPMDEPITMLVFSLVLGCVHLLTGYTLKSIRSFKNGKPLDGILDSIFVYFLFFGVAGFALSLVLPDSNPEMKNLAMMLGIVFLIASLAGILLTAGRHNKGVFGKIIGGFSGLYGVVNIMSDVLSYARLFGLALASGAIGFAFNTLGSMFFSVPVVGYALGIILLIPLHAFNLGIGLLGAYVHNARLQFLEFYGKFYEGGGHLFTPMGEKTKYVRFN